MPNPILDALLQTLANSPHPIAPIANAVQQSQSLPNIDLGKISIGNGQNKAQQAPVQPPIQPPIQLPVQPTQTTTIPPQAQGQGINWGEIFRAVGVPLAATIAGVANPNMLAGAAGLSQGYAGGYQEQQKLNLEKEKYRYERLSKEQGNEKEKWDDAYRTAIELSKTGALGGIEAMTPEQLDTLAGKVYQIRYGKNKDINLAASLQTPEVRTTQQIVNQFNSVQEAEKANLPKGTEITINGRKAVVE